MSTSLQKTYHQFIAEYIEFLDLFALYISGARNAIAVKIGAYECG